MMNNSKFFCNKECEYYPCHKGIADGELNCLFCFCPLYNSDACIGAYQLLPNGCKDCSQCAFPHDPENYDYIIEALQNEF